MNAVHVPRVLALTDRGQLPPGRSLVEQLRRCVQGGLTHVVVREHDLGPADRHALIAALAAVDGLTVLSSRIPDPAAAGVHLAASQGPGDQPLRGRSCHTPDDVRRAVREGMDYVTLSPFAASRSKPGYGPVVPREWFAGQAVPVLALGGIDEHNAREAMIAGAAGVAVMGALMRATAPDGVTSRIRAELCG